MKKIFVLIGVLLSAQAYSQEAKTANGILQGVTEASGIVSYKGVPFAQAPVGNLRWKEPRAPLNWKGIRKADHFGPQAMQRPIYSDMLFRSAGKSEDCLYLNIWTPAKSAQEKLPVLVYFYGGGLNAGDGSEYRYDGEALAKKGIITITVNYRLGIFGFLAHPDLTAESPHHASGNYGLLDQHAALVWVKKNVAAFGGDPDKITIAGESAGSMSVCGQIASPLSKGLFVGGIGESGSFLGNRSPVPLTEAEANGLKFAKSINAASIAELRKIPADTLLKLAANNRFPTTVDGYFLPESPQAIYATGRQMDVPLLAGWNTAEVGAGDVLGKAEPTVENYQSAVHQLYGNRADEILRVYPANTDAEVLRAATDLASDKFIAYATWKFIDLHSKTNGHPVYRYLFARKRPGNADQALGAVHASEIEYALGNLPTNKVYAWTDDDYKVSETMQNFFVNFVKTGNPNGTGLPTWYGLQSSIPKVMVIDTESKSQPEKNAKRYVLMDSFFNP
ncbi:carboxylesterase family protein [Mucilaginibacter corticis]|uniref:Carboxylic ester hydrolase n=2 Tax=Mucilaginibacter corticis TaxID=2597670 RepID=A0A556M7V3_9SPHI|nr:carboxylesterase family protein [Mucilaginibacter corticis]